MVVVALAALLGLMFLGVPLPLYLLAPVLGWVVVSGQVNGAWSKMRLALEKELPTFLLRMSATIQATPNVPEAVADVTASLDPAGPLQAWMKRLLTAMQTGGRKGLEEMREEAAAISPSLMLAVMELERLWETGGSGYVEAFRLAADNLASILEGRAMAAAKADGAWGTVRVILLALGGSLVAAMSSGAGGGLFNTPAVQVGLLVALAWAALGWNVIGDMIREVME
jgi:Flp pilus assembly protein TadB